MKLGMVVVMGLLAVSCTGAEPEENSSSSGRGTGGVGLAPYPQVRALEPVEKIAVPKSSSTCSPSGHCPIYHVPPEDRRAARDLVAELEHDKPHWLRYLREVDVVRVPVSKTNSEHSALRGWAQLKTGIIIDKAGKVLGHEICASLLERHPLGVSVEGVVDPDYNDGKTQLAAYP